MPTIRAQGATLYYEVHGDADRPAVTLAHGMGGNAVGWFQQVPALTQDYRVVVLEQRGFGRSHCDTPADFDRSRFVDDLRRVLDDAGIARTALVGQSMGGFTALGLARENPDRVTALVLCATTGGIHDDLIGRRLSEGRKPGTTMGEIVAQAVAPEFGTRQPQLAYLYDQIKRLNTDVDYSRTVELNASPLRVDPASLKDFRIPTLVIGGARDALVPADVVRRVAQLIPGAEFRLLDAVGHSTYFEDAETFNAVLGAFLTRHLSALQPRSVAQETAAAGAMRSRTS